MWDIFNKLNLSTTVPSWAGDNTDLLWNSNMSKITKVNIVFRPKKTLLFSEMWVTRKIFTWAAANLSFFIVFQDIFSFLLLFLLFSFNLDYFLFFYLSYFKLNMFILIDTYSTTWAGEWQKIFTRTICGNKTNFFGLISTF